MSLYVGDRNFGPFINIQTSENMTIHIILLKKVFLIYPAALKKGLFGTHIHTMSYMYRELPPPPPPRGLYEKIALSAITSIDFLYSTDTILISGAKNLQLIFRPNQNNIFLIPF